ncbi:peptidase domain-containing ABC transporter [Staphylococcus equorum]|uniref:peptidase domain-containing ABC transporter n=1 Tax=Staphylococcus equorum TaxID=246432 RepID=UPI003EBA318B
MKFKYIEQLEESDCGPACLAMISNYYGKKVSVTKIRNYANTDTLGTNINGMIRGAKKIGINLEGYKVENVKELLNLKTPFIALINNEKGFNHYVIIKKIKNNNFYIIDPAHGNQIKSLSEFCSNWLNIVITIDKSSEFNKKPDNHSYIMKKKLKELITQNQMLILFIFISSIIINLIGFIGVFYFKELVDKIIPSNFVDNLINLTTGIFILYLISLIITFIRFQLILHMSLRISKNLMLDYYYHILKLPIKFFDTRKEGEILSRFRDSENIRQAFSSVTVTLLIDVVMIFLGSFILYRINSTLFLVALFIAPLYVFLAVLFKKPFEKLNKQEMEKNAELSNSFIEGIRGINIVKSFNKEDYFYKKTKSVFLETISKSYMLGRLNNLQLSFKSFFGMLFPLTILCIGSYLVMNNRLSLGELIAFNSLLIFYIDPIERLIDSQSIIQSALVASRRVMEIMNMDRENLDRNTPKFPLKNLSFEKINFSYSDNKILSNINFDVDQNTKVAIVGESGSGKSTIAKLILNYYEPESGKITFNNNMISTENIRTRIGYVPQNNYIFQGTIEENLMFDQTNNISYEKMVYTCKQCQIHDFIMDLPMGYQSILESNGDNISGGQAQRLSIARALLKNPDLLILDEATSGLDVNIENKIKENLNVLDISVIAISHRLNFIKNFDEILVMKNGHIIERGDFQYLISTKGYFHYLWNNQS